ncbi:MFS transporter [Streptomyces sp. NPDC046900]|uniref:MFS transporter n=1 Tax=Streptomyces sp. NPDC046900 TaxID=3155473 RepID=UPI0033F7D674
MRGPPDPIDACAATTAVPSGRATMPRKAAIVSSWPSTCCGSRAAARPSPRPGHQPIDLAQQLDSHRRPVLLGILVTVLAGSLIAAVTHSLPLLLVGRALQGTGYGIFPIAVGIVREEIPAERVTRAMADVSGMLSVGGGVALAATGLLTNHGGDYRRVFWLAAVLTVLALVLTWLTIPARRPSAQRRADRAGAAVLAATLVLLLTPLSQGNRWGWNSLGVSGCLIGAAAMFSVFVLLERATPEALVTTQMLSRRPLVIANVAGLVLGIAYFAGFLGVTSLVETPRAAAGYGFGASVLSTSLVYLLPGALSGLVTSPLGGELVVRLGPRATLVLAMLLAAVAFTALAFFYDHSWEVILATVGIFAAVVFGYATLPALLSEHVSRADTGVVNSVNSVARTVGSALATLSNMRARQVRSGVTPVGHFADQSLSCRIRRNCTGPAVADGVGHQLTDDDLRVERRFVQVPGGRRGHGSHPLTAVPACGETIRGRGWGYD